MFGEDQQPEEIAWAKAYYDSQLAQQNSFSLKVPGNKGTAEAVKIKSNKKTAIWTNAISNRF